MTTQAIVVASNPHYLATADGEPFFWLGDTAWEIFHRLNRQQVEHYLENRRQKGFNIFQACVLSEFGNWREPNVYGDAPFIDGAPDRPHEPYWQHVDFVIQAAAHKDIYVALLPVWGDKVSHFRGDDRAMFDAASIYAYGRFLGARYALPHVIWMLGGDRPVVYDGGDDRPLWRALAAGIDHGAGGKVFKTFHPFGGYSSSEWLHQEAWLDMNTFQSGHGGGRDIPTWDWAAGDVALHPAKPTLDSEPNYEDLCVNPWPEWNPALGHYRDHDVRKQSYRSVFAGACGVTYGHHSVWQMHTPGREVIIPTNEEYPLEVALDRPGAWQMIHLRRLIESRPYFSRIPAQHLLPAIPAGRNEHLRATCAADGCYAMIYAPSYMSFPVLTGHLAGEHLRAWWFNPRTGRADFLGEFPKTEQMTFTTPVDGPDWVLVLDDAVQGFPAPGVIRFSN
jgi:hypothetical protein